MKARAWQRSRFDSQDQEPLGPLANLTDVMLVFICGLVAALISLSPELTEQLQQHQQQVIKGRELPALPDGMGESGKGYESVGRVFRDPQTGKLILMGEEQQ